MKRFRFLALALSFAASLFFCACTQPTQDKTQEDKKETAPVLPLFSFTNSAKSIPSRFVVPAGTDTFALMYFMLAPEITGFDCTNAAAIADGSEYTQNVLGDTMRVSVAKQDDGTWLFAGTYAEGWVNLVYDPAAKSFSYEQCGIFRDPNCVLGQGSDTKFVTWMKGNNISLDASGHFHTVLDMALYGYKWAANTNVLIVGKCELYRGLMKDNDVGTGVRTGQLYCVTTHDGNYDPAPMPASIPDSATVTAANLQGDIVTGADLSIYYNYLSHLDTTKDHYGTSNSETVMFRYDDPTVTFTYPDQGNKQSPFFVDQDPGAALNSTPPIWLQNKLL